MKKLAMILVAATMVSNAFAVTYTDATGDLALGTMPHIDITQVDVTNTLSDITFNITLNGSPIATNWGKYNIIMRKNGGSPLDTATINNPWGRTYNLTGGSTAFLGSWVDGPTTDNRLQSWTYTGSWGQTGAVQNTVTASSVSLTVSLSSLGLAVGDVITFDAVTTGSGPDTAVDSLTGASPTAWNEQVALQGHSYTIVPEPGTMAALGLGAMALIRRRRAR